MKFHILDAKGGGYYVRARGDNNETMLTSEVYTAKASAEHAIDVVKTEAEDAPVYDLTD